MANEIQSGGGCVETLLGLGHPGRIKQSRCDGRVAEQLLNVVYVSSVGEQPGGEGSTEAMRMPALDPGQLQQGSYRSVDGAYRRPQLRFTIPEEIFRFDGQGGERGDGLGRKLDLDEAVRLLLVNAYLPGSKIEFIAPELGDVGDPQAGVEEGKHQGEGPDSPILHLLPGSPTTKFRDSLNDGVNGDSGERYLSRGLPNRRHNFASRILRSPFSSLRVSEEHARDGKLLALSGEREMFPCFPIDALSRLTELLHCVRIDVADHRARGEVPSQGAKYAAVANDSSRRATASLTGRDVCLYRLSEELGRAAARVLCRRAVAVQSIKMHASLNQIPRLERLAKLRAVADPDRAIALVVVPALCCVLTAGSPVLAFLFVPSVESVHAASVPDLCTLGELYLYLIDFMAAKNLYLLRSIPHFRFSFLLLNNLAGEQDTQYTQKQRVLERLCTPAYTGESR